jgi:hypothetical protein
MKLHSHLSKVLGNVKKKHILSKNYCEVISSVKSIGKCKKKSLYNQPKPYFFQKNYCEVISG